MTDTLLAAVPGWGPWLVMAVTFLSCLGLPAPASLTILTAAGFAAVGDLVLWQLAAAALAATVMGDQVIYWLARGRGEWLLARLEGRGNKAALAAGRARGLVARRGAWAVFLTRWLLSPLGPYANIAAGLAPVAWLPFTLAAMAGSAVWIGIYLLAGTLFGTNIEAATQFAGSILGFLATGAVAAALGWGLWRLARSGR